MVKSFWHNEHFAVTRLLVASVVLRFFLTSLTTSSNAFSIRIISVFVILGVGAIYVLKGTADVIEETTEILSQRTKLAGGLLQSLGTAFPDMVMGVAAALISLRLLATDYQLAIRFAIIAAATTFGSNIYNIGYSIWCIFRQTQANQKNQIISFFPMLSQGGKVTPMQMHKKLPTVKELDTSMDILNLLTILTALVAIGMVVFGKVTAPHPGISGELYQLIWPVGVLIGVMCVGVMIYFRNTKKVEDPNVEIEAEEKYYRHQTQAMIWLHLLVSGLAIFLAADSMILAIQVFCALTGTPLVVAGALGGVIGCLGEILVIHDYTTHPQGRIGDALTGVAMDNIVTTLGASLVSLLGGIFLGGNALILIFVLILTLNSILLWQISRLKNFFVGR